MMSRCSNCATSWTSLGMTMCPICGTKVPSALDPRGRGRASSTSAAEEREPIKEVGSAVLELPSAAKDSPQEPKPAVRDPLAEIEWQTVALKSDSPVLKPEGSPPEADVWLRTLESILPVSKETPDLKTDSEGKQSPIDRGRPVAVDARVVLKPAPARPLNGPLILGALALVTAVVLPLTAVFESSRVFGIIGLCMSGFFLPFAPIAWLAGLSAEKRRREQGLRPEKQVVIGRLLGQWGTLLLVAEVTIGLILVAALRLSGGFPTTFWAP